MLTFLSRLLDPLAHEKAKYLDDIVKAVKLRLSELPQEVNDACAAKHANGAYGWFIMKQNMPFGAREWAFEIELELAKKKVCHEDKDQVQNPGQANVRFTAREG